MSDDEYYDDEFADFHDMLYDADPDPDLADDLAEHAAHSPVYFDNPNEEAREYFSDWEYYSDDYFDDDPRLLRGTNLEQGENAKASRPDQQTLKRGRKRKLSEVRKSYDADTNEARALRACIQGTVWKVQSPELVETYKEGDSQPVALRLSKSIMRSAYSRKQGFGRGRTPRDETWANDLSLADMGLRTESSMDRPLDSNIVDEQTLQRDKDDNDDDEENATEADLIDQAIDLESIDLLGQATGRRSHNGNHSAYREEFYEATPEEWEKDGDHQRKKRRKIIASESSVESKPSVNTPETSVDSDPPGTAMEVVPEPNAPKRGRGRPRKHPMASDPQPIQHQVPISSNEQRSSRAESTAVSSTASSRAKSTTFKVPATTSTGKNKVINSRVTKTARKTRSQQK